MGSKSKPTIKACKASENWTSVSFTPDLAKFGMSELEEDAVALMRKRVYDLAGVLGKGVKVTTLLEDGLVSMQANNCNRGTEKLGPECLALHAGLLKWRALAHQELHRVCGAVLA